MITQRLMKPGRFNLALTEDAPYSVWAAVAEFDHIVITPMRLTPITGYSDANILASSIYTGVVTAKPTPLSFEGQGLEWWLGTDEGLGALITDVGGKGSGGADTLATWVTLLRPASLSAGTVTNTGTSLTYNFMFQTRREALDYVCRAVGAEWRVNPSGTLDAAAPATLFPTATTPTAVITRRAGSNNEGALNGFDVSNMNQSRSVNGYTTKVFIAGRTGDGAPIAIGSSTGANVYKDLLNGNVALERLVNAPATPAANTNAYAASMLGLFSSVRRSIDISSDTYAVPLTTKVGDTVWVFDRDSDLYDSANQIVWRGELIAPIKLRCKSLTWPVQAGMGVYARRSGGTPVYTDLTDFVQWETGATVWEVGAADSDVDLDPAQQGGAYLGDNPAVNQRNKFAGVLLTDAAQTIAASTLTDITWGTEVSDPDGWTAGGIATLTVPSGFGGRYAVSFVNIWAGDPTTATIYCIVNGATGAAGSGGDSFFFEGALSFIRTLVAGDTVKFQVTQRSAGNLNVTSRLEIAPV